MNGRGHLIVQRRHHLFCHLHDSYLDAFVMQIFRHFQADETAADDRRPFRFFFGDIFFDPVRVRHGPKREDPGPVDAGDRRLQRGRTRCNQKGIISLLIFLPGFYLFHTNCLIVTVDG